MFKFTNSLLLSLILAWIASTDSTPTGVRRQRSADTEPVTAGSDGNRTVNTYISDFKEIMADYVKIAHPNLTGADLDTVKLILQQFLTSFADDLRELVQAQQDHPDATDPPSEETFESALQDDTYSEIRERIRYEFPQITEYTAKKIVDRLRTNLMVTRLRIDIVIKQSKVAQETSTLDSANSDSN